MKLNGGDKMEQEEFEIIEGGVRFHITENISLDFLWD